MQKPITLSKALNRALHAKYAAQMKPTCILCEKPALYRVGTKGYCKVHRTNAISRQKLIARIQAWQERQGMFAPFIPDE